MRSVQVRSDAIEATLDGTLSLHGVDKTVTVIVRFRPGTDKVYFSGEVELAQTDFGITPIRIGGGTVRVKDKVKIQFEIVAVK